MLVKQATWFCEMCITSKPLEVKYGDDFQKAIEAWLNAYWHFRKA
jgi:hypothetical protein